jgi:hypothetical protein
MGYQRKSLQILGGSWNPLPSVDKVPDTDYLLAQNWRTDRIGKLVSRYGYPQKFSIAGGGVAHSAGQHGGVEGDYYVAANSSGANGNAVYYNFGTSPIATGFDGNRVGFAAQNGYMYVMNRGKQGRHTSAGWEQWGITPPSASPRAATGTPTASTSATFSYAPVSTSYVHFLTVNGTTYSFTENGYSAGQLPLLISLLAGSDPNVTVTYAGTPPTVTITPIPQNTLIQIAGSDGNGSVNLGVGTISQLPNGTYTIRYTFANADSSLESNPGPPVSIALTNQGVTISGLQTSSDTRVTLLNFYASGGNLAQPYQIGQVSNGSSSVTLTWSDLDATNNGIVMPVNNDLPPAASGLLGPYYSRLYAWSTAAKPHRLFYTPVNQPQYWPGSADNQVGNWVDVGTEGEAILWCTQHTNLIVIYKERSTWQLIGDPESDTSVLEQIHDSIGIAGAFAVVSAGQYDYLVSSQGLHRFDTSGFQDAAGAILPLFNASMAHLTGSLSALSPPGGIAPGPQYGSDALYCYALALGYAMGKLYIGYTEQTVSGSSYCLLVFDEKTGRWFYHRNAIAGTAQFEGFFFDGAVMCGLTGTAAGAALGFNLDDFRSFFVGDYGPVAIECVYQSHFEDAGLPDNQKNWLEVVIDYEFAGDTATVYVAYDNGDVSLASLGTITGTSRKQTGFALPPSGGADGVLAKNISVGIYCQASAGVVILHNVHLYYYEEARLAQAASTIPVDLGIGKVKQVKELELDIDASGGVVTANIYSDLPGNALALRHSVAAVPGGRAILKYPMPLTEGYLWRVALTAASGPFRLYAARLLTRVIGTYVEAYEAAAGFVWDSMEQSFDSGVTHIPRGYAIALAALPIKRAREIRLEIDAAGPVTVALLTDLPGDAQATRFSATVAATTGRAYVGLPLPAGVNAPIEGRMFRLQISGASKFLLYAASLEVLPVGVYVEAYEAAGGAVYDSREIDFGSSKAKEAREIELDVETTGAITATLYSDLPGYTMAQRFQSTNVSTSGRQKMLLPLTAGTAPYSYPLGRLFRVILSGANAFRLYGARLKVREMGTYLTGDEAGANPAGVWDSTPLDFGSGRDKSFHLVELDVQTDAACTLNFYTSQDGGALSQQFTAAVNTGGNRETLKIRLTPGIRGRLFQVAIAGAGVRLFAGRVWWRARNEPQAQWQWGALPIEPTPPEWGWGPLPVQPTEAQWWWAKFISVEETADVWTWADIDMSVQ